MEQYNVLDSLYLHRPPGGASGDEILHNYCIFASYHPRETLKYCSCTLSTFCNKLMEMQRVERRRRFLRSSSFLLCLFGAKQRQKEEGYRAVTFHASLNGVCVERWEREQLPPPQPPTSPSSFVFLTSRKLMVVMISWSAVARVGFLPGSLSLLSVCISFFHTSAFILHLVVCFVCPWRH